MIIWDLGSLLTGVLAKKRRMYGTKKPATNYIIVVGLKMGPLKNQETVNLKLSDSTKF